MKMDVVQRLPGRRVLWQNGKASCWAEGNEFFASDASGQQILRGAIGTWWERGLSSIRLSRQLLRLGIHHMLPLPDGAFLVILRKRVFRVDKVGDAQVVVRFERGNKPASKGVCVTPEGDVLMAEYAVNTKRTLPMMLYRSRDSGRTFEVIYEFAPGKVCHFHFVQWDRYAQCLWMGTGDFDHECLLYRSMDGGDNWELMGGGSQLWRAVGLAFRPGAIYWGTDAGWTTGTHPNHIMRFDRHTGELEKILDVQGPCHGNATLSDGTLLISTGVERGDNEKDNFAHLWASRDGSHWEELTRFKKDMWCRVLQFGVIRFPQGLEMCDHPVFTCMGLSGAGETSFITCIRHD